jgi:hypothetical protein
MRFCMTSFSGLSGKLRPLSSRCCCLESLQESKEDSGKVAQVMMQNREPGLGAHTPAGQGFLGKQLLSEPTVA